MLNKVLNVLAVIFFALSLVSYITTELELEAIYLVLAGCFLITVPRSLDD